uniref:Nck-associated protein 1-like n=1 Tax=Sinocyclocheilus rhinocerous TaxID=307959 RepID=A0A673H213_9TELE
IQCYFNIAVNFDFTKNYLDLIVTHASVIYMLSRIDDKKAIVGMYNCAYEFSNGNRTLFYHSFLLPLMFSLIQLCIVLHSENSFNFHTAKPEGFTEQIYATRCKTFTILVGQLYSFTSILIIYIHQSKSGQMAELLYYMEKLRTLLAQHRYVIQRYHLQYLSQYDALALNDTVQGMYVCPEEESVLMSSFVSTLSAMSLKHLDAGEEFDLKPFRLDWLRLQAYTSISKAPLALKDYPELAKVMNMAQFHTRMMDNVNELLCETADLSILCFHARVFEKLFSQSSEDVSMQRYLTAFPVICSHFSQCLHPLCPEETEDIKNQSLKLCVTFLEEISRQTCTVVLEICAEQCNLHEKLLPKHSAETISTARNKKLKKSLPKKGDVPKEKPGTESLRKDRVIVTNLDKMHQALTELCASYSICADFTVFKHIIVPAEFLLAQLEIRLNKVIVQMANYKQRTHEIARPSDLLAGIQAYVTSLHSLSCYINIDVTRLVKSVLLQQMQPLDSYGAQTITTLYTNWFLEGLLRQASRALIVHCPTTQCFVNQNTENEQSFHAEEYSDICGLRSLAELIGPFGLKFLNENLMWHIISQVGELKKLVSDNMDALVQMRANYENPEAMSDLQKKLTGSENVLKRMTIVGVILSFSSMIQDALEEVNVSIYVTLGVYEMASAAGLPCEIDPALVSAIANMQTDVFCLTISETQMNLTCFSTGHQNNIHCLATAVNHLAAAMFTVQRKNIQTQLQEFLKVASSILLQLGQNVERVEIKNRDSVYLLLHMIVEQSPFLSQDMLEMCFPYVLLRNAYREVHKTFIHTMG